MDNNSNSQAIRLVNCKPLERIEPGESVRFRCGQTPRFRWISCLVLMAIGFLSGCQSTATLQQTANSQFDAGRPQQAIEALREASEKRNAETEILQADLAIAELMAGNPKQGERQLKLVQEELDFLSQKDLKEQTLAVLSDSRSIAYSGREFEDAMVRNLLTVSSLVSDKQDAFAFASQAMEIATADFQQQRPLDEPVEQSPGTSSHQTMTVGHHITTGAAPHTEAKKSPHALAAYLHAIVHSENAMDRQLTSNSIRQISHWSADQTSPELSAFGTLTPEQHGGLHVITFSDRITDWVPEKAMPTTAALLLADQILSATGNYSLPPTVAPVQLARPASQSCQNPYLTAIQVGGQPSLITGQTLLDLNHAAWDSYQADRDKQIANAVARRIVKKAAVYATKDQMQVQGGSEVDALLSLGGVIWESLEKADTRHISFLPGRIEVVNTALPVGQHTIHLTALPANQNQPSRAPQSSVTVPVDIQNGRNTIILCFRIGHRYVGHVLTSDSKSFSVENSLVH